MAGIPTVAAVGATNSGTGAVTYTLPAHQLDDVLVLFCEDGATAGLTAPTNWAHITNSPRPQGANVTAVSIFWKRAISGSETNPQVPAPANHQVGFAVAFRGVVNNGNPWDFSPVGNGGAAQTTVSATGGTSSVANTLVVVTAVGNTDTAVNQFSGPTNASLANLTTQQQIFTTDGNGGGVVVYTGEKAAAGATGTTTATMTSLTYSALTFALLPDTTGLPAYLTMAPRIGN